MERLPRSLLSLLEKWEGIKVGLEKESVMASWVKGDRLFDDLPSENSREIMSLLSSSIIGSRERILLAEASLRETMIVFVVWVKENSIRVNRCRRI